KTSELQQILVVRDFLDVFLKELPGIPLEREIKFNIKLLLDTNLIFIIPYHMIPIELKELEMQLQDFLNKGFIKPNSSLWGASVLLVNEKNKSLQVCIEYR